MYKKRVADTTAEEKELWRRVGAVLRQYRERRGLSPAVVAQAARLHPNTVYGAESGHRPPTIEVLVWLAAIYGASLDDVLAPVLEAVERQAIERLPHLISFHQGTEAANALEALRRKLAAGMAVNRHLKRVAGNAAVAQALDLVAEVAAGYNAADSDVRGESVAVPAEWGEGLVAVRLVGDSLEGANLHPGDVLVGRHDLAPEPGNLVVAWLAEDNILTAKFYFTKDGRPVLRPANPRYPEYEMTSDDRVVMVVRRVLKYGPPQWPGR